MHRLTLTIHGQVQGVFFREESKKLARQLDLVGYVYNNPDGTVALVAEGEEGDLKKLLNFCKIGPQWASVSRVEEKWESIVEGTFKTFRIDY